MALGTYVFFKSIPWKFVREPQNEVVLRDQFLKAVGSNGYWSAYDFVHRNIKGAVIQFENGLPYYLYGPSYTNTPTSLKHPLGYAQLVSQKKPEYFVVFRSPYGFMKDYSAFPKFVSSPYWLQNWVLLYYDSLGRVYKQSGGSPPVKKDK